MQETMRSQSLRTHPLFLEKAYIGGKWITSAQSIEVIDPATAEKIGTIPCLGKNETQDAIEIAHKAFSTWKDTTAKERFTILMRWNELIIENQEILARILTKEQGKPLGEASKEILYGASFVQWFAEETKRINGDVIPSPQNTARSLIIKQPVGVVAAITPWNFPNAMITRKVAPALAAGCTVVIKPSELTPYSALALAALAEKAGFPDGVINVVTGDAEAIGKEMTRNPLVKKVTFTGSTAVGKKLVTQSAQTVKKVTMELGGNAPFIVFDDANIDKAVQGAIAAKYRNAGQTCVCTNRFFIHESIYEEFTEKFIQQVKQLKVGNGFDEDIEQGPLINENAVKKVEYYVQDAIKKGAQLLIGGSRHHLGGLFFEPTILSQVSRNAALFSEEIFGPVSALFPFRSVDEVIKYANDTVYGLASYFYTQDLAKAFYVAEALEYGMVSINEGVFSNEIAPFGGVKESGLGREGSQYGIEEYLEMKYVYVGGLHRNFS